MVSRRSSDEMELVPAARSVPVVAGDSPAMREWAEQLVARARAEGVELTGDDGLLTAMVRQVLQTGLAVELTDHLGYEPHDPAGRGSGGTVALSWTGPSWRSVRWTSVQIVWASSVNAAAMRRWGRASMPSW